MGVEGKTVFITGGSSGIGRTLAEAFAQRGASVAISARELGRAETVAASIRSQGGRAFAIAADVRNAQEIEVGVARITEALGSIDILVNNAGVAGAGASETFAEDDWNRIVDTNLKGAFLTSQAVGRGMLERRFGRIVNIASTAGMGAFPKRAAYGASKAALIMLTKVLAVEWADRNVRVNAIAPGVIRTELNEQMIARGFLDLASI